MLLLKLADGLCVEEILALILFDILFEGLKEIDLLILALLDVTG